MSENTVKNDNVMKVVAGLDIGNGYVKGIASVNGERGNIEFESSAGIQTNSTGIKTKGDDIEPVVKDIYNKMEVSFDTPAIKTMTRRLIGKRGSDSGKSVEEFDVASMVSKADQDLSGILALSALAGRVVEYYWDKYKKLPNETIKTDVKMTLALPISEYKSHMQTYINRFKGIRHMIMIHNFENPVRVEINVTDVMVYAEGSAAQFAIINGYDGKLIDTLLVKLRNKGVKLEGVTADDVRAAENTLSIDIGEGTVNFPVFTDGKFNPDASIMFQKGYGTILEQARERLMEMGIPFSSRKALASYIRKKPTALTRPQYNRVVAVIDEEKEGFIQELSLQFRKVMSRVGASMEVIYVYGGGSAAMEDTLYDALINMMKQIGGEDAVRPIFYLPADKSGRLNAEGLYWIADEVM